VWRLKMARSLLGERRKFAYRAWSTESYVTEERKWSKGSRVLESAEDRPLVLMCVVVVVGQGGRRQDSLTTVLSGWVAGEKEGREVSFGFLE
jgi:hypothetical protein